METKGADALQVYFCNQGRNTYLYAKFQRNLFFSSGQIFFKMFDIYRNSLLTAPLTPVRLFLKYIQYKLNSWWVQYFVIWNLFAVLCNKIMVYMFIFKISMFFNSIRKAVSTTICSKHHDWKRLVHGIAVNSSKYRPDVYVFNWNPIFVPLHISAFCPHVNNDKGIETVWLFLVGIFENACSSSSCHSSLHYVYKTLTSRLSDLNWYFELYLKFKSLESLILVVEMLDLHI